MCLPDNQSSPRDRGRTLIETAQAAHLTGHPNCRQAAIVVVAADSCTERENLTGDAKGKGTSGSNREAESTDAPERGGLPRSSDEAGVMLVERRGRVIAVELGPTGGAGRSPKVQRKAAAFARWHEPDDARVSSPDL